MNTPLISVVVVSYNSEDTIINTLNSIEQQRDLDKIEVVITDDASKDNTVGIAAAWKNEKVKLFSGIEIVTVDQNSGVTENTIRGTEKAKGKYIRYIAADDCLPENSLMDCAQKAQDTCAEWVIGRVHIFSNDSAVSETDIRQLQELEDARFSRLKNNFDKVKKDIYFTGIYNTAAMDFYARELIERVDGFDPRYPMMEDQPFILKLIEAGTKPCFTDDCVIDYRLSASSISHTGQEHIHRAYTKSMVDFFYDVQASKLLKSGRFIQWIKSNLYYYNLKTTLTDGNISDVSMWGFLYQLKEKCKKVIH